jgi:hypothetical protein
MAFDEQVAEAEMRGETPLKYANSPAVQAVQKMGKELLQSAK